MLRKGDVFAGYTIRRVLGYGGMGVVYLARHPRLPRLTALKLLSRDLSADDEIRHRFEREADLVAQLEHPNIVNVYDRGTDDDQLWISMQYVAGTDVATADVDVLPPERAVQIIAETATALDFAHAGGVLHRDVKPANILLAKPPIGRPERVVLTDFGIAAVRDSETTLSSSGAITATLAYAAPEHLAGAPLDHRADQYSLACTLFWMLTGRVPFPGPNPAAVIQAHLNRPVPPLRGLRPDLPTTLDVVLARATAKRADARYDSCAEFAQAARSALFAAPGPWHRHHQQVTATGVVLRAREPYPQQPYSRPATPPQPYRQVPPTGAVGPTTPAQPYPQAPRPATGGGAVPARRGTHRQGTIDFPGGRNHPGYIVPPQPRRPP
ncbi:serine/threonine protein kinase [Nocardia asteroides NBRC 15531]|uniref:non-specific serine/threonine protein kinase n=1 Tax=Nocardia asteroides NBRC 15531 TaxID=1110697 RepID=U5EJU2_NOCAS|nr:serine/threonine-protein kinase [Nocardia asteroides]TLF70142.1 serine/threonine protein kinase [Nocardia asteroides NBRC 15531]UGT49671.1 protein kinase [Nocardia asteroides]SFL97916.1 serine/threonine protein kinase [Nocardia asteroides]VEG37625.1 Serine/threonine-protein kinase pknF [Nocardia asteroides]BAO98827.1 putative serine/threonine protein kinase [Nocardia asteroides NBRC 15531]